MKATYDIQAAHQFPPAPQLRVCRPIRPPLQPLPDLLVGQNIEEAVAHPPLPQDAHQLPAEAALRRARRALHEQHDRRGLDELGDALVQLFLRALRRGHLRRSGGVRGRGCVFGEIAAAIRPCRWRVTTLTLAVHCYCGVPICFLGFFGSRRRLERRRQAQFPRVAALAGVFLNRGAHFRRVAPAHGFQHLAIALQHEVGDGGDVEGLGDVGQFFRVDAEETDDGRGLRRVGRGQSPEDEGLLGAWGGPGSVEGEHEEGRRGKGRDVGIEVGLGFDGLELGHDGNAMLCVGRNWGGMNNILRRKRNFLAALIL